MEEIELLQKDEKKITETINELTKQRDYLRKVIAIKVLNKKLKKERSDL